MAARHKIPPAELAIHDAAARLENSIATLAGLRTLIVPRLPIAEAEAEMEDIEDQLDAIRSKLGAALVIHEAEIERLQLDADVRYAREHGLFALADMTGRDGANDNKREAA